MKYLKPWLIGLGASAPLLLFSCSTCQDYVITKERPDALASGHYVASDKDSKRSWDLQLSGDSAVLLVKSGDTTWEVVLDSMTASSGLSVAEDKCVD